MRVWILSAIGLLAQGQALPAIADTGTCVYRSETYSEGAAICVQKGLMLSCTASGERLIWKVARDAELSDLCRMSPPSRAASVSHRPRRSATALRAPALSAKCFQFNGKTYCE